MKLRVDQQAGLQSAILQRVRAHPGISRVALARELQLAPSTVGNYVGHLLTAGLLAESEKVDGEAGRPAMALRLNPAGGRFIGVDFEARNIMAVAMDFSAQLLKQAHREIQQSDSVSTIMQKIEQIILEVLPEPQEHLLAIGVGVPGLVDPLKGIALDYKYIQGWRNVSLANSLAKRFGVPVYLENTIRSMALAELWFGQGRGVSDWLCLGIRSGIGAGIVAGGQLQRGAHYQAGEIGRWRSPWPMRAATRFFVPEGSASSRDIELQEVASARALLAAWQRARRTLHQHGPESSRPLAFADLIEAVQQRDRLTVQLIAVAAELLGWAVGQLALALNPTRVILAGPLTLLGETLLEPLRQRARELLVGAGVEVPEIVNSTMGEYNGALGAAALAVHEWKPSWQKGTRDLRL